MKESFNGAWALITGASSGIGKEYARRLAEGGMNLVIVARRIEKLTEIKNHLEKNYGVEVVVIASDLSKRLEHLRVFQEAIDGRNIQVLINNAGVGNYGPFQDYSLNDHIKTIDLNVVALTSLTYYFIEHMRSHGLESYVTNIASIAAYQGIPYFGVYCGTKKYVRDFTEALAFEYKNLNIDFCCVCPGGTYTEFLDHSGQELKKSGKVFMMSTEQVVEIGLNAMWKKKITVITGVMNWIACHFQRLIPGQLSLWIGHNAMKKSVSYNPKKVV